MLHNWFKLSIVFSCFMLGVVLELSLEDKFYTADINPLNCETIFINLSPETHTIIILIASTNLNPKLSLRSCLKSDLNKTLVVITGDTLPYAPWKLSNFLYNRPDIIIISTDLRMEILLNPIVQILFRSHWSLVNIVITNEIKYQCKDGVFKKRVFARIESFLNKLWHTYETIYAIVQAPRSCPGKFAMYSEKKRFNGGLYDRNVTIVEEDGIKDMLMKSDKALTVGYPLKANIFYRFPTSITQCNELTFLKLNRNLTNGYCGLDALVMYDVIKIFNFNVSFPQFANIVSFGYVSKEGEVTGSLGGIVRGEIDISFNSRFFVMYLDGGYEFLNHISHDALCAVMKEPDAVPLWYYPFNVFTLGRWLTIAAMFAFMGVIISIKTNITCDKSQRDRSKLYIYFINTVWAGFFGFFLSTRIKRSTFTALILLSSIVFMAQYQGHINYMFATLVRYQRFQTLTNLYENNVDLYTSKSIASLLGDRNDTSSPKSSLLNNLKFYPSNDSTTDISASEFAIAHPYTATLDRGTDVMFWTFVNFTDKDGRPKIYVVNECIQHYYLSYIVRSGFPFTRLLQSFMTRLVEVGLPQVYYKWTRYMFSLRDYVQKPESEPRPSIEISMLDERIAFTLLLVGYALSTAVFIMEKRWYDRKNKIGVNQSDHITYIE